LPAPGGATITRLGVVASASAICGKTASMGRLSEKTARDKVRPGHKKTPPPFQVGASIV